MSGVNETWQIVQTSFLARLSHIEIILTYKNMIIFKSKKHYFIIFFFF